VSTLTRTHDEKGRTTSNRRIAVVVGGVFIFQMITFFAGKRTAPVLPRRLVAAASAVPARPVGTAALRLHPSSPGRWPALRASGDVW
jgi:hypothetical protein